jgi:uncharacterized protein
MPLRSLPIRREATTRNIFTEVLEGRNVKKMNEFIESRRETIIDLCRQHGVKELYLFGSALRDDFGSASDVDFLVEFDWSDETNLSGRFLGLKSDLESLFARPVDLVCYSAIRNPYFKEEVESQKQVIYAA